MTRARFALALALAGTLASLACASREGPARALDLDAEVSQDANTPLGGVTLSQRRLELARAQADMVHFLATLDSLRMRRDQNGQVLFKGFVDEYLGTHVDPMLATGNSAVAAVNRVKETRPRSIRFVCLLTCPQGLQHFHAEHPDVPVYTAAIDSHLNDHGYIVPGLGDAGDRLFGTR